MAIEGVDIVKAAAFLGAGISMGLGAIGPGIGEGMAAAKACEARQFPSLPESIHWLLHYCFYSLFDS